MRRPGENICANWEFSSEFFFVCKNFSNFLTKKEKGEKNRICDRQSGHNFGHLVDKKQTFF